jgi:hypothetical protein
MSYNVPRTGNARRWRTLSTFWICVLGLMLSQPTEAAAQDLLTGSWRSLAGTSSYDVVLTISGDEAETRYSELNCTGKLTRLWASDKYAFYAETITEGRADKGGKCTDGLITIMRAGDHLALAWVGVVDDKPSTAHGLLSKEQ